VKGRGWQNLNIMFEILSRLRGWRPVRGTGRGSGCARRRARIMGIVLVLLYLLPITIATAMTLSATTAVGVGLPGLVAVLTLVLLFNRVEHDARESLREALSAAEAADRAKGQFLANMSHEIRTPMNAILGYTDLLLEDMLDKPATEEALQPIRRNGEHLLTIIDDLLDLSKIDANALRMEQVPCSPRRIVEDVLQIVQLRAYNKGLPLEVRYTRPIPERIVTDPTRLRQILLNVVGNAIKFTEQGGVRIDVRWDGATSETPSLRIDVRDTGIGMTAEQLSRLFQPFSQADESMSRRFGGTGLGLTISRRLAEILGGSIIAESDFGNGSTFTITVAAPAAADDDAPIEGRKANRLSTAAIDAENSFVPLAGVLILLAEDAPDNQRLLSHLLRKAGAEVAVADNGQVALDTALAARDEGSPFDVIIMDMQLPVVDGYEATRALREAGYDRPIVALTAHSMPADRNRCLEAGCDDYAAKPIERAALISLIRHWSQQHTAALET
jgi:signal transduction histidine kinase/ActR/RegA family two-component response regulator